jgi:ATP-dependent helicase/nuclease subunit A
MTTAPADPADQEARIRIARDLDTNLMVVAGAGTGKTTALVGRIVALVGSGAVSLGEIAAITFTETAAAELRQRIREALEAAAADGDDLMATARDEVDDAAICTLHSFARRILLDQCVDAGLPPGFEVLDDTADVADFEMRWNRFADALLEDPDAERALVLGFSVGLRHTDLAAVAWNLHTHWDRLEDGGLDHLRQARTCDDLWPSTDPGPVIDALDRARGLLDWCTDDGDKMAHHLAGPVTDAGALLTAARSDSAAVLQLLDTLPPFRCAHGRQENWTGRVAEVRAACTEAEQARLDLLDGVRRAVLGDLVARLAEFTLTAADQRRREGHLTFHDLLVHVRRLVRRGGPALSVLRRRYRRLLIDEFQDTDPLQVELAARLTAVVEGTSDVSGARAGALFVVGDPKQSIYRFRRANIELFTDVGAELDSTLVLGTNFRSVPGIVDFVNVVFDEILGRGTVPDQAPHHALETARPVPAGDGAGVGHGPGSGDDPTDPGAGGVGPAAVQLTFEGLGGPDGPEGPDPTTSGGGARGTRAKAGPVPVVVLGGTMDTSTPDVRRRAAADAATAIADLVGRGWLVEDTGHRGRRPVRWGDVTLLIPSRSTLPALEDALEDAGVPFRLEGAALLWGAEEVRNVLTVLRAADDPADAVAVLGALRSPGLACGDDDLVTWHAAGGTWDPRTAPPSGLEDHPVAVAMAVLDRLHRRRWWSEPSESVASAIEELHSFELALAHRRPRDHWHRLRWLQDQARLFDESPGGTLRAFLTWAALRAEGDGRVGGVGPPDPDDDAVRVMTIHGAKGLEFPVVVLAGLERDPADAPRPPSVVWTDHHVPEIHVGRFTTAGFEQAGLRDQRLDLLEQHRLLYVGMTRARDHLLVCLHHKRRNGGPGSSLAAIVTAICADNPSLWRALPATVSSNGATPVGEGGTDPSPSGPVPLPARWEEDRIRLLATLRRQPVVTATAVARQGTKPHRPTSPDVGWDHDDGLRIGRAVHGALAELDLATGCDDAGRPAEEVARAQAVTHGVAAHAANVAVMVGGALTSPTIVRAASRRHWCEVYVTAPHERGLIEGFVDLLFEEQEGLVVVDYKTDRLPAGGAPADAYRLQVATYAVALESSTGLPVIRCVLVFVGTGEPREHIIDGDDLAVARAEATRTVEDLVTT